MHKCKKSCDICPYVKAGKVIKAAHTDVKVHLQKHHDCESRNIVYIIQCKKCWWAQYIGETKHSLATRFKQHLGYVNRRDLSQATGRHFSGQGHSTADMTISVLEKINQEDPMYRKEREHFRIQEFDLVRKGLNGKK